ncbi:ribosome biogenesis GTPase [Parabacteroides sp. PF5-5]|uniref:ribosome small subunit-dependent GTPase A n=1 Tax=unclassified Parabacteroides TaxID=2649774 RepID=UPI002474C381|nr:MULTISPECIES: ribosome small subunit-dependent GTPase A [unclassified Parabacteroides]MDH6303362.1 ribosome biogenesis GTPase [Parabacteroides sp. PH5-39]MDH6318022.1 ribosome biogenesis GTPase [Parabacteroides sp. PH5-13]MDH6322047.1 ribosome biogenesis GTPase [Parabacteroides sp. PH5-8]MDH6326170.1 ribosome biogenesis GTPase [Parabacteroides sp. PH5-41]MDH6333970.1 ribosome biogenesis GTPase [Parabacteroides sp. PF5-5]
MNNLQLYGWNEELFQQKQNSSYKDLIHGRVTVTHKTCYEVVAEAGFYTCELAGNMLYGKDSSEYPCTGDWVIFQPIDTDKGIILDSLPRQKTLYRLKSGTVSERQAIASFIDKAFIVQSLDENFNVRRIERFLLQTADEDIQPVLVLTKTDLGFDKEETESALKHISDKIPVFYTSTESAESIAQLRAFIAPGETIVFTGMSGVGKSTLINALCGRALLQTGAISDSTGKGKHTSTRREMVLMPDSGVLIDTPGIKLFGVTSDNTDKLSDILDISDYEGKCRFKDCQHVNEKGCAVIEAVENGEIDRGVYDSYLKLRREAWHYTASVHEKRKYEKSFTKMVKNYKNDESYLTGNKAK